MNFNTNKPIFQQIAEAMEDMILNKAWPNEERIPSVRDMAVAFGVNPNTVMRSFNNLQEKGLIENKRGVGYFTSTNAFEKTQQARKKEFLEETIPHLSKQLKQTNISIKELTLALNEHEKKQ